MPHQLIAAPPAPKTRAGPIPQAAHLRRSAYKAALAQPELAVALVLQFRIFGDCVLHHIGPQDGHRRLAPVAGHLKGCAAARRAPLQHLRLAPA